MGTAWNKSDSYVTETKLTPTAMYEGMSQSLRTPAVLQSLRTPMLLNGWLIDLVNVACIFFHFF